MIIVMMKTITLIAIGMMVLVVIIMPLNGIFFVLLVNVLIPMLVRLRLLLQIVMTNGSPKSVKKRRSRENATRKKSKRTVKKPVTCARKDFVYIYSFAFC